MIRAVIIFLPLFTCLFGAASISTLAFRTDTRNQAIALLLTAAGAFFIDALNFLVKPPDNTIVIARLFARPLVMSVIPLAIWYFRKLRDGSLKRRATGLLWLLVPAVFFTATLVVYLMIGRDVVHDFTIDIYNRGMIAVDDYKDSTLHSYFILNHVAYQAIIGIEILVFVVFMFRFGIDERFKPSHWARFFLKGGKMKVTELQAGFLIPVFILFLVEMAPLGFSLASGDRHGILFALLSSGLMSCFSFTALFGARKYVSLAEMKNVMIYNYGHQNKEEAVETMMDHLLDEAEAEALSRIQRQIGKNLHIKEFHSDVRTPETSDIASRIFDAVSSTYEDENLLGKFQRLMRDEMLFLKPGLSLDDVATRLDTNKFYVSKMVNNTFNLGFPEVINILRVDYAEQFIINHPDAKQTEIATRCGFLSASTFNTIFKKVTGMTPKMWVASQRDNK